MLNNNNMVVAAAIDDILNDYFLDFINYENIKVAIYKNIPINLLKLNNNISCLDWDISGVNSYYCLKDHSLYNLALSFDQFYKQLKITIN
jgi:hypothetical protein